jgi:hypothetical protein
MHHEAALNARKGSPAGACLFVFHHARKAGLAPAATEIAAGIRKSLDSERFLNYIDSKL